MGGERKKKGGKKREKEQRRGRGELKKSLLGGRNGWGRKTRKPDLKGEKNLEGLKRKGAKIGNEPIK